MKRKMHRHQTETMHVGTFDFMSLSNSPVSDKQHKDAHNAHMPIRLQTQDIGQLVHQLQSSEVYQSHSLTCQLVDEQLKVCECSQTSKLGWDAT